MDTRLEIGRGKPLTRAQRQQIAALRSAGVSRSNIAKEVGCSLHTVHKWLKPERVSGSPLNRIAIEERAAKLQGIPRHELRDKQKQIILERLGDATEDACLMILELLRAKNPSGFMQAMSGFEKLDKVSGNAAGETQEKGVSPVQVTIDLRSIIDQVLEKHGEGPRPDH